MPIPSAGSVPDPSSSRITRLSRSTFFKISSTLTMWDEKVERFSDISWPSPISQRKPEHMQMSASRQATWSPVWAIIQFKATVLMATVFPPVLGPVMTMPRTAASPSAPSWAALPSRNCSGTLTARSISG